MSAGAWAASLEASALGQWMRTDAWAYPFANVVHVLGLTALVGPIVLLDLRLLGFGRALPLAPAERLLTATALVGLLLMVASGSALFSADATALIANPVMRLKLALIAVALTNAVAFRWRWSRQLEHWDRAPPMPGRAQALASIALWLSIPVAGRLIAYV